MVNGTSTLLQMVGLIPLSSMRMRAMLSVRVMPVIVAYASPPVNASRQGRSSNGQFNGRLTLVIDEPCGVPVPTRFALSARVPDQKAPCQNSDRHSERDLNGRGCCGTQRSTSRLLNRFPWLSGRYR